MLTQSIVYAAYFLKSSERYHRSKQFFYDCLENPHSLRKKYFDALMIGLIVLSIILLLYHIEHEASTMGGYFEQAILLAFILEYLLRGWIASDAYKIIIDEYEKALYLNLSFKLLTTGKHILAKELEYITSAFAIIDILAILPSYRPMAILQVFIVFRLFKLFRYSNSAKLFANVLASR